jgi:hypothetical protein
MRAGQQLGLDIANHFMLTTLSTLIADLGKNPDGFRNDVKKALFDLTDTYQLPGVVPELAQEARDAAKQVIAGVLQNPKPLTRQ